MVWLVNLLKVCVWVCACVCACDSKKGGDCFVLPLCPFWVIWNLCYTYSHLSWYTTPPSPPWCHNQPSVSFLSGYMEVVQIPKGSVHIEIRELAMSKNYIGKCLKNLKQLRLFSISCFPLRLRGALALTWPPPLPPSFSSVVLLGQRLWHWMHFLFLTWSMFQCPLWCHRGSIGEGQVLLLANMHNWGTHHL